MRLKEEKGSSIVDAVNGFLDEYKFIHGTFCSVCTQMR
jgi:hypothetical protein